MFLKYVKVWEILKNRETPVARGNAGSYTEALNNGVICTGGHVGWGHLSQ